MLNFFHCALTLHWKKLACAPVTCPTVIVAVAVSVCPELSVTVSVTVNVPVVVYACVVVTPEPVVPSPKSHA